MAKKGMPPPAAALSFGRGCFSVRWESEMLTRGRKIPRRNRPAALAGHDGLLLLLQPPADLEAHEPAQVRPDRCVFLLPTLLVSRSNPPFWRPGPPVALRPLRRRTRADTLQFGNTCSSWNRSGKGNKGLATSIWNSISRYGNTWGGGPSGSDGVGSVTACTNNLATVVALPSNELYIMSR